MTESSERQPSAKPLRIAVIGLGGAAQVIHLPILSAMESFELVGVADIEPYKLSRISEKYDLPGFLDHENLLRSVQPDAVLICTPTINHLPIALSALRAGVDVILEKPVTRDYEEVLRLADFAREAERRVLVAMNHRFRQDVTVMRNFLASGELGRIWRVRLGWLKRSTSWARSPWLDQKNISGGGVLMDLGLQMLDFTHWLLGCPKVERVVAFAQSASLNKEVEDTVSATIAYETGTTLQLDVSWGLLAEQSVAYAYFEGEQGSARLNPLVLYKTLQGELVNVTPVRSPEPNELYNASFEAQMHHFASVLRGEETTPVSTVDEAVEVMQLVDMIYRSSREGREIRSDEA
ncbi:MAG TPA: Gfo/Idh/MocA family oxidoreductase [Bacteroidetes bacterium]|nr:Gfo/Idh/MocA family oxidoreductase [Bacteroidota bacterium]